MKILYSVLFLFLFSTSVVNAGTCSSINTTGTCDSSNEVCTGGICMTKNTSTTKTDGVITLDNPLGSGTTVQTLIGKVIKSVLGVVGSLALLMFIYGGFTWMTAAGASDKVTKGRDTLVWAVIGLVVVFSAYAMVKFVFTSLAL